MSGDFSRDSFDAFRHYAGVFLQQGRTVLDSDWNELVEILERRIRAGTVDTIGRAVVPRETPLGFEVRLTPTGFEVGRGRLYLDGVPYENHGAADFTGEDPSLPGPVFDRGRPPEGGAGSDGGVEGPEGVLDEMIAPEAGDFVDYLEQPYWPTPEALPEDGPYLVYLVGWRRAVTPTECPELLEPALGGLDTTTRWQNVWQVRTLAGVGEGASCALPDEELEGWLEEIAPSTARLSTGTTEVEEPEDPCLVPPTEGYTGVENQFYRVEIHTAGATDENGNPPTQGDARFKFSRENASVRASVVAIAADAESVTVGRIGRDDVLRFRPGDWVEITDDHRELNHRSGQMLRVADVHPETRTVDFEDTIDPDLVPAGAGADTVAGRHTRLVRWDQAGVIRLADESEWADLDADGADGLIPVPSDGRAVVLENGITVAFGTADGAGGYRELDYWRFTARTAGPELEILRDAPPEGVQRHYTRLAVVPGGGPNQLPEDCRVFWPPRFEAGEGCACTVCVNAEGHNSGELTIQDAIDEVGAAGGSVCLDAGIYLLREPVRIDGRNGIRVVGQGLGTVLIYRGGGGAVQVDDSADVRLERFSVLAAPSAEAQAPVHGVAAVNTALLALRRLAVLIAAPNPEDRFDFGLALDGTQIATKIEECVSVGPHALGSRSSYGRDDDGDVRFAAFAELRVLDCVLFGGRDGVLFDRAALNIAAARLSRNVVLSTGTGLRINWAEIPAASLAIDGSTVGANRTAMMLSAGTLRVQDCEVSGGARGGDGILLVDNLLPGALTDGQIVGNTIFDTGGAGIRIAGTHDTLFIKRNIIRDCAEAGIATTPEASVRHLAVDNNHVDGIGLNADTRFAAGIALTAVESGQVIGNSVHRVGDARSGSRICAGIGLQGVGSVDVSSNVVSDIGRGAQKAAAVGILVQPPFLGITMASNRVIGELERAEERADWRAIRIGPLIDDAVLDEGGIGKPADGFATTIPAFEPTALIYLNVDGTTWAASATRFGRLLPMARPQITLSGNHARTARPLAGAMVSIVDPAAVGLAFGNNHCDVQSGGDLREVVLLGAPAVSATGNHVTHTTDGVSLRIVTGRRGGAAPVANLTTAAVEVHPGGLPAAFAALNIRT